MTLPALPVLRTNLVLDAVQSQAAGRTNLPQSAGTTPDAQGLFGIASIDKLEKFAELDTAAHGYAAPAPASDDFAVIGTLPGGSCIAEWPAPEAPPVANDAQPPADDTEVMGTLPDRPCTAQLPEPDAPPMPVDAGSDSAPPTPDTASPSQQDDDNSLPITATSNLGGDIPLDPQGDTFGPGDFDNPAFRDDVADPVRIGAPPVNAPRILEADAGYMHTRDANLRAQYGEMTGQQQLEGMTVRSYEQVINGVTVRTNVTEMPNGTMIINAPVPVQPPPTTAVPAWHQNAASGSSHASGLPSVGGGGGGGFSWGAKLAIGTAATAVVGGIGVGFWALADRDSFDRTTSPAHSTPAATDPGQVAPLTLTPLTSTGDAVSVVTTTATPTNVDASSGQGLQPLPAPVSPIMRLPMPGEIADAINLADLIHDHTAVQELLHQWQLREAPVSTAALQEHAESMHGEGPVLLRIGMSAGESAH